MKRHHAQLKGQARYDEHQAKDQHLVAHMARRDGTEHFIDIQRTGGAVEHGHAVEQKARGHGAQYKILHRRFHGLRMITAQRYERVAGQGEQLQAHVNDEEVITRNHDEHAKQGKHGQGKQLAATQHVTCSGIGAAID